MLVSEIRDWRATKKMEINKNNFGVSNKRLAKPHCIACRVKVFVEDMDCNVAWDQMHADRKSISWSELN